MIKKQDIRIRDPFIITDKERGCYYMYGTTGLDCSCTYCTYTTFSVYKTYDLENFEEPKIIFDGSKIGFWGKQDYWAPEVHKYNGKYYLFASFKAEGACRATHILVSDTPDGTFVPVSNAPATPKSWECLDGTLYVEDGVPYIVFCHEWLQVHNGEIWATQLSDDLSQTVGEPFMLFKASDDPFVTEVDKKGSGNYVTDGPFFYCENGKNKMIWSSFHEGRYVVLSAELDGIRGKIRHNGSLFDFDGGHAMIFHTLDGKRMISLHSPNKAGLERPHFFEF
jgi:GH43 family beta-xylosidase